MEKLNRALQAERSAMMKENRATGAKATEEEEEAIGQRED